MPNPIRPLGLDHAVLWVRDLPRAVAWYRDVLGCVPAFDYPEIGMAHLWFGGIILGLWDADDPRAAYALPKVRGGTNVDHLALAVGPFERGALMAHLAAHGVPVHKEEVQVGARGVGRAVYIHDPWGNRLELKGPPGL
ncbi:VOC family protein [Jannaschia sp. Os4]|uniref:VOC family protein n=1 Tax=Jannaschia sp. Os4 TaxID=2807617 RepID=UPI00193A95C3|nr:VOC family protein [Jannaschia sp. Os4]MBM2577229.1 VOC family protein [Jannaschia sp. Os4]